jgi:MFS family permease
MPKSLERFLILFWAYAFVASYSFGYGPISNIVSSEIYPVKVRARALGVGAVAGQVFAFMVAMSFMSLTESLGLASTFFLFSGVSALCCIFCYRYVPETKGRSIEEVSVLFDQMGKKSRPDTSVDNATGTKPTTPAHVTM